MTTETHGLPPAGRAVWTGPGRVTPRVLIVGWGFLGASIGNRLLTDGVIVTGLSRSETWRTEAGRANGARVMVADARDAGVLDQLVGDVDHIVFAAGGFTHVSAVAHPSDAAMQMLLPLLAVLESVRERPQIALTYISSGGAVYGAPERLPIRETDAALPITPYGAGHLAAETFTQMWARRSGSSLQILRCANVYGPYQAHDRDQGAVAIFLHRISGSHPVRIFGDGSALRDYVYIDDVADVVARIICDRVDAGTVNVGSGRGLTVLEIVEAIGHAIGQPPNVVFEPARDFDIRAHLLDITRIQSCMPYTPTDFEHGLELTVAAFRESMQRGLGRVPLRR